MEAGLVSKNKGSFRVSLNVIRGFDFSGGHTETKGRSPTGAEISVPLHRHDVSLDFTRIETEVEYSLRDNWDLWLRVPYEIKERTARIGLAAPASAAEQLAMRRNLDLHHKNNTLTGFSDLKVLGAHRLNNLLRSGDTLDVALGLSLPIGETEEDPFEAGDAGREHEHIQFGTGTFDPLLELYYAAPISESFSLGGFAVGRFPFYENSKSYRGPIEVTAGPTVSYQLTKWLSLHSNFSLFYQNYAYWNGSRDINSGLLGTSGTIGAGVKLKRVNLNFGVRYPFTQEALSSDGDTFEQGPTILLNAVFAF